VSERQRVNHRYSEPAKPSTEHRGMAAGGAGGAGKHSEVVG
jgi:hypothetical protein